MLPILYSTITEGTVPSSYGEGVLSDCLSCSVNEARNGEYELTMEYSAEGIHADAIVPNAVIKAKPNFTDSDQLFRIYKVGKTINGHFTVNAQHISYDLSGKIITSGTANNITTALEYVLQGAAGNFTLKSYKSVSGDFSITEPSSVRSWFGGKKGSILDVYGPGEWKYDNFSAEFMAARGQDRGVTIRYGKNLTELSQTLDMSNLVSSVIPYYKDNDGNVTTGSAVSTGLVGITKELAVDFSSSVDPESATPIVTQLATLAASYVANNNLTQIKDSITLDFVQTKELSERVDLCDTVHIYFEPLGLTATAKCIETVWDVLGERYTSTTFGDPKTNIADTIVATQKAIDEKPSETSMSQAIKQATELITGNLGGYVVLHDSNGDGEPDEILIMDTADIATATNVWRWNSGGLGFSPNGYAGPYDVIAIDMQGRIVADAITTGTLNANLIKAGVISDVQGNSSIDMTSGAAKMKNFKAIENFQLIDVNDIIRAVLKFSSIDGASFEIQNQSGYRVSVLQEDQTAGGQIWFFNNTEQPRAYMGAGSSGGILQLWDNNARRHTTIYNASNGGGCIQLWDKGQNESSITIYNDALNPALGGYIGDGGRETGDGAHIYINAPGGNTAAIDCYSDSNGNGHVEALNPTHGIMAVLRAANNGGVIDVYDTQYLNIQLIGNGGVVRCVTVQQTSSRKVKENVKPMTDYKKILDLEAVSFDYKNKALGTDKRGFIAEDVAEVIPNLVTPETEDMPAGLDYVGMIPYLQAVIKDQERRIAELEKKINEK